MGTYIHNHPALGPIEGVTVNSDLLQFRGLPYARIPKRFARSELLTSRLTPSPQPTSNQPPQTLPFDATKPGSSSIQPEHSAKTDAHGNQFPSDGLEDEPQSEDCLNLTVTLPTSSLSTSANLPVVVFIHGGAFFLGAGTRGYYTPYSFVRTAVHIDHPLIFVSVNYRLGFLGFGHSPEARDKADRDIMPPNNGLHDQLRALEWVKKCISGFGGDAENVTVLGQSAGGESISLHNASGLGRGLYRRSVAFSGTSVTMPAFSASKHEENFREQAGKLGIEVEGRKSGDVAKEMVRVDVSKIRNLAWVGAPCTGSEAMPDEKASMRINLSGRGAKRQETRGWLESQVVSATGYDGSISYIMTSDDPQRTKHAAAVKHIAEDVLGEENAKELLDIYGIVDPEGVDSDEKALERACLFESDIGFIAGAVSVAVGSTADAQTRVPTYFQLFTVGNPFPGPLAPEKYASHTWDIVALLGAYDEQVKKIEDDSRESTYKPYSTIIEWRKKMVGYMTTGQAPWAAFESGEFDRTGLKSESGEKLAGHGKTMVVSNEDIEERGESDWLDGDGKRRRRLFELAQKVEGSEGWDVLWQEVCRRFLMAGE